MDFWATILKYQELTGWNDNSVMTLIGNWMTTKHPDLIIDLNLYLQETYLYELENNLLPRE